ncbi:alcohol dehydrogenase catalytic domain-containing protein, partial [Devosia sp.]|uniref:alcohol dehydrogenase catalytic domain-containing protein n=1 Tax=Devosia sp. TaxID=1871048 RepID=UPI0035B13820
MKIRAAVLEQSGLPAPYADSRPLKVRDVELAGPGEGEVLVRVVAAGLCHSDLSVIDGNRPRPLPMVLGHEAAGVVEELGTGVHDLSVGDHVVFVFVPSCGSCECCIDARPALCIPGAAANGAGTLLSGARRLSQASGGHPLNHHLGVSGFAEYATVARNSLVKVDRSLAFEHAALFGCAVLTGVGAALNGARVRPADRVAIIGLGGVGAAALLGARAAGAERVVAVDISREKLDIALALGATDAVLASDADAAAAIREMTGGGVDHAIELAGSVAALQLGYQIIRRGGELTTGGLPPPQA